MNAETVLILANGEWGSAKGLEGLLENPSYVIAVDGGWAHARNLHVPVDEVIGDMDSLSAANIQRLSNDADLDVIRHPVDKDYSDLELALARALLHDPARIDVYAATGGRLDHTLVNVGLTRQALDSGVRIRLVSDWEIVHALRAGGPVDNVRWLTGCGRTVSILPQTDQAIVRTEGLRYPLHGEMLERNASRGVSNMIVSVPAVVSVASGDVIVIESDGDNDA